MADAPDNWLRWVFLKPTIRCRILAEQKPGTFARNNFFAVRTVRKDFKSFVILLRLGPDVRSPIPIDVHMDQIRPATFGTILDVLLARSL